MKAAVSILLTNDGVWHSPSWGFPIMGAWQPALLMEYISISQHCLYDSLVIKKETVHEAKLWEPQEHWPKLGVNCDMSRDTSRDSSFCFVLVQSLYGPGCPRIPYVAQAGLRLAEIHLPLPRECWDRSKLKSLKQDRTNIRTVIVFMYIERECVCLLYYWDKHRNKKYRV